MSVEYLAKGYNPQSKNMYSLAATSSPGVAVWTPSTSMRVVITDLIISQASTGTIQINFGIDKTLEFYQLGSVSVHYKLETPLVCPTYDRSIYVLTHNGGFVAVNALGFETV